MENVKFDFSAMNVDATESLKGIRKENNFYKAVHLVGMVDNEIKDLAEVRYYGTGKTNTAIIWIHSSILGLYGSSYGKAGGYGYNREQAAFEMAVNHFNIKTTGWVTDESFFEALANHLGVKTYSLIHSHG